MAIVRWGQQDDIGIPAGTLSVRVLRPHAGPSRSIPRIPCADWESTESFRSGLEADTMGQSAPDDDENKAGSAAVMDVCIKQRQLSDATLIWRHSAASLLKHEYISLPKAEIGCAGQGSGMCSVLRTHTKVVLV